MLIKRLIPDLTGWLQDANSMLVSACCHLTFLIAVGLASVGGSHAGSGEKLVVQLGNGQDSSAVVDLPAANESLTATDQLAAQGQGSPLQDKVEVAASLEPAGAIESKQLLAESAIGAMYVPAPTGLPEKLGLLHGLDGTGLGGSALGGGRAGDVSSAKAATEFFGIGGYGQTFVYVVDCSDSMNENGKFQRARYELLQSIEQLAHDQQFFVIFYNHRAHPMDAERPVMATEKRVAETRQWINDVEASGGTNPLPALLYALSMRPDAIYFLSDGQFDPATIQELRIRNRANLRLHTRTIPIHTIAFYDRFAEGLMRTIARNSGGEYRFVK